MNFGGPMGAGNEEPAGRTSVAFERSPQTGFLGVEGAANAHERRDSARVVKTSIAY